MKMIKKIILGLVLLSTMQSCLFYRSWENAQNGIPSNEKNNYYDKIDRQELYTELNDSTNMLVPNDLI